MMRIGSMEFAPPFVMILKIRDAPAIVKMMAITAKSR